MAQQDTPNLFNPIKGLHTDFHPESQPAGTYTYLLNGIRSLAGGRGNEKGTVEITILNKKVIGGVVLDEDLILFLYPSEIGVLDKADQYVKITDDANLKLVDNQFFGVVANKNYKGERIVIFVDGVNPDRYLNLDNGTVDSLTFIEDIKLQLTPDLPLVNQFSVIDGGNLPTGVYQATARLLTRSTNTAPFGLIGPVISIVNEPSSASFNDTDGAPPQTVSSKAIIFNVTNIDPSYEYLELAIITYIGTANVSQAYLLPKIQIQGRTELSITYSSTEQQNTSVDLSNIAIKPVNYDNSKHIVQKDNIVVRSNLSASSDAYDFQLIANKVKLRYFVEEIPWQFGYKDPINAALKRSYRRGETYSFAISPDFKSSYATTSYHIAPPFSTAVAANTTTKELGKYTSTEEYPTGKNYPLAESKYVRHFVMPTMDQEPTIVNRNGAVFIRILGIEADFSDCISMIPDEVKKNLRGFKLLRQLRTDSNKSILTQGIAQIHTQGGNGIGSTISVSPASGSMHIGAGVGPYDQTAIYPNDVAFYSPESVIYQKSFTNAQSIVPVAELFGTQKLVGDKRTRTKQSSDEIKYAHFFLDYSTVRSFVLKPPFKAINAATIQYVNAGADDTQILGQRIPLIGTTKTVNTWGNNGYLYFNITGDLPINEHLFPNYTPEFRYDDRPDKTDLVYLNGIESGPTYDTSTSLRYLYNLTRTLGNQYGAVSNAIYIYCDSFRLASTITKKQFFGGDTFIGKFSVISSTSLVSEGYVGYDKFLFKSLNYFFVESEINVDLRHYNTAIGIENQPGFIAGTVPYYPKYQSIWNPSDQGNPGLLNLSWALGHSRGYNKQYSFENSIVKYQPKALEEQLVTKYENRSVYSEQGVEGEQFDAHRVYLPNNYHDIPKDRGPIMNTVVHKNTIYLQTTGATYRTFFNEKVTMAANIGQVYLGTGGVFDRPSEPLQTVNGGYGGTQGKWGVSTPYGFFYIDARQKIVFNFDEGLSDLTGQGLDTFFSFISDTDQFKLVYDYKKYRLLITSNKGWTLSYQTLLKSWSSFHSYIPYWMISRGTEVYLGHDLSIHKLGVGPYSEFFGIDQPLQLEYVANQMATQTKSYDNLVIHSAAYGFNNNTQDREFKPYSSFGKLRVSNDLKDTGTITLVVPKTFDEEWLPLGNTETFAKYKNQEYRIAVPVDRLIDPLTPGVYDPSNEFRPRMSGKWSKIWFEFNHPKEEFVLHTIELQIRGVAR